MLSCYHSRNPDSISKLFLNRIWFFPNPHFHAGPKLLNTMLALDSASNVSYEEAVEFLVIEIHYQRTTVHKLETVDASLLNSIFFAIFGEDGCLL